MAFVKVTKNKAYYKRFQVKYRRRREGKTDYYARQRLIVQAKNKYNAPKYRLVVRLTNTDVICQVVYARISGDVVLCSAYSHELPKYGVKLGLTNYAAAYCTGLLCARRALEAVHLSKQYPGQTKPDGQLFVVAPLEDAPRPFKVYLDVGLKRTSTGARVFGAMKGAADGGLYIPHSERRFPGYKEETKTLDAAVLRSYIFGGHVANYMRVLKAEDEGKYKKQFSRYLEANLDADLLEGMYAKAHAMIRDNPAMEKKTADAAQIAVYKTFKKPRLTLKERKAKVARRMSEFEEKLQTMAVDA